MYESGYVDIHESVYVDIHESGLICWYSQGIVYLNIQFLDIHYEKKYNKINQLTDIMIPETYLYNCYISVSYDTDFSDTSVDNFRVRCISVKNSSFSVILVEDIFIHVVNSNTRKRCAYIGRIYITDYST